MLATVAAGNEALDALAAGMAAALADPALRGELRNEALKKFDGDYDVLYSRFKQVSVAGRSVESRLGQGVAARRGQGEGANIAERAAQIPRFNIGVFRATEWKTGSEAPLVAYAPMGVDDLDVQSLKAYDANGNVHWLDAKTDPTQTVIVLGNNERTDDAGNVTFGRAQTRTSAGVPGLEEPGFLPPPPCDPVEDPDCDTGGGGGGGGGTTPTYRQQPSHLETLAEVYVEDDCEYWFAGDPEIVLVVKSPLAPDGIAYEGYFLNNELGMEVTTTPNRFLWNWVPGAAGGYEAMHWREEDVGAIGTITFKLSGIKVFGSGIVAETTYSLPIKNDDDIMGKQAIHFTDPLGLEYNTGYIRWKMK